ncbi:MAG: hypothetical protein ACRD08_16900 [Acidimicrobiales bacterium]
MQKCLVHLTRTRVGDEPAAWDHQGTVVEVAHRLRGAILGQGVARFRNACRAGAAAWRRVLRLRASDLDDLIAIAESELTRSLTDEECQQYQHVERCPQT